MEENTTDTVDRISFLPEFIAHQILSNLLDFPEALVRMSVLSKDWFALTASFPILDFRIRKILSALFRRKNYNRVYKRDTLLKNVAYTTSRFCKQNVSAHTLTIDTNPVPVVLVRADVEILKDCLESVLKKGLVPPSPLKSSWLFPLTKICGLKLPTKGLRVLEIRIEYPGIMPMLHLPNILLSVSELSSLTISECELLSSLMVDVLKFKSLKLLSLSRVPIYEGVIEYLTTSFPLLEEIYLKHCYGFTTFCVDRHLTLQKVQILCKSTLERIHIEAPNLRYFHLTNKKDKAPSINMASCNKLTTFCYEGAPLKSFTNFLSNFPFMENLSLGLTSPCNHVKLSNHSLRRFELCSNGDLEEIDINTPNLLLFEFYGKFNRNSYLPFRRKNSSQLNRCMIWHSINRSVVDTLWFQKLRRFLDRSNMFKVLKLVLKQGSINIEELKGIKSLPYELEHVELDVHLTPKSLISPPILDALLWCCRPRSLTLDLSPYTDNCHVVQKYMNLRFKKIRGKNGFWRSA
nr:hypothetical protein [Tanacetum cinerariifolium]